MVKLMLTCSMTCPPFGAIATFSALKEKVDLQVEWSDHTKLSVDGMEFCEDGSISRCIARFAGVTELLGENVANRCEVETWLTFAEASLSDESDADIRRAALVVLTKHLQSKKKSFLTVVGSAVTVADFVVWSALSRIMLEVKREECDILWKYYEQMSKNEIVQAALQLAKGKTKTDFGAIKRVSSAPKQIKDEGKYVDLHGAEEGKVVVRFPPEASGYLHIGHAKAAMLNQYYQQTFKGTLIMRFDDTNPAKETEEFEKVILEDLKRLNIKPDRWSHTSDYFAVLLDYCEGLIKSGKAYVDDTDPELIKQERELRRESRCRNNSVDKNLQMWNEMKIGSSAGQKCCVRLKINMNSHNGCMRDPTIYRCKKEAHLRTGAKYCVYPTYDFACPIVDSIEGVTNVLRTTEYHDRDEQYYYILDALQLRKPHIYEYSRLNMMNTVMSKRKLTWLVNEGIVDGWDDPRLPTVRGLLRRGMTVEGLKQFIVSQGSSRSVVMMDWNKLWAFNKKVIDPIAPRYTALLRQSLICVCVAGGVFQAAQVPLHPKIPETGNKTIFYAQTILIEKEDVQSLGKGEVVTLIHWGNAEVDDLSRDQYGTVRTIRLQLRPENQDYKRTRKLTWLPASSADEKSAFSVPVVTVHFDEIITKAVLGKDEDFKTYVNFSSKHSFDLVGEHALVNVKKGDIIQLQRKGFYICDQEYKKISAFSGAPQPCILFFVPDGHVKELPTALKKSGACKSEPSDNKVHLTANEELKLASDATPTELLLGIKKVGDEIRHLKGVKTNQETISQRVAVLQDMKARYRLLTRQEWNPSLAEEMLKSSGGASGAKALDSVMASTDIDCILAQIKAQGEKVRDLKSRNVGKDAVASEVSVLKSLKAKYTELSGKEWIPALNESVGSAKGCSVEHLVNKTNEVILNGFTPVQKPEVVADDLAASRGRKKTRLGLEVKKEDNFAEWYSQVITKAEMIEYYDISGCYVIRPWAFAIWESVHKWFDAKIKELGVLNCYFPIFVSKTALEKEKTHITDFSPEVAWVTRSGQSEMAEPIAVRPTSETVMYPSFAKWIQSHRDLPLKVNQWCNIVRWEFKHPTPFIRTREILWQEGHTAFSSRSEAIEEVRTILDLYAEIYENLLAIPVIKGRKTEKEKFAGADFTLTIEAYISASGRGIQAATSHHLGQNFSKMFEIVFEDPVSREKQFVYQNSWGITTRTIGVLTMVHGDNSGLVLPPRIAKIQVIIIPCGITARTSAEEAGKIYEACIQVEKLLLQADIRCSCDLRANCSPGWKFNHWELKGVPLRVEIGPRDVLQKQVTTVRRDTATKQVVPVSDLARSITETLEVIQQDMFDRALKQLSEHRVMVHGWNEFLTRLDEKCIILAPFCNEADCENKIKKDSTREESSEPGAPSMGAKALCIPAEQPQLPSVGCKCVHPDCNKKAVNYTLFGRSY